MEREYEHIKAFVVDQRVYTAESRLKRVLTLQPIKRRTIWLIFTEASSQWDHRMISKVP